MFTRLINWWRQKRQRSSLSGGTGTARSLTLAHVLQVKKPRFFPTPDQLRQLPRYLSESEKRLGAIAVLIVLATSITLTWRLYNSQRVLVAVPGGTYTEGLIGTPQLINPLYASASDVDSDLAALIYSGLMKVDASGQLVPDLASSYSISENGKEYVFILRDDAHWQDGQPVRVQDVIFTFAAIQNPDYRSPLEVAFTDIKVEQVDDKTLKFTLPQPFTPFLSLLTVGIMPAHVWQDIQPINAVAAGLNRKPLGSGPYRLKSITRDNNGNVRSYTLVRHDGYHGHPAYIKQLTLKFYPDLNAGVDALKNKNVEGLAYLPLTEVEAVKKVGGISLQTPLLSQYTALYFNNNTQPIFKEKRVRQAIDLALDRQSLINTALDGHAKPIDSPILDGMPGYTAHDVAGANLDQAKQLLTDSGWIKDDASAIRHKDTANLEITLTTINNTELSAVADTIKTQLEAVGFAVTISPISNSDFQASIINKQEYQMLLAGSLYGTDPDPYVFWHSSQTRNGGLNLAQFLNAKADKDIETGRTKTDLAARAAAYSDLASIIKTEMPAVFLYQPQYAYPVSKDIQGLNLTHLTLPEQRFGDIANWYIKTRRVLKSNQ